MLKLLKKYRNGQAAHKKSVLLNSALIKLNNVLSDDMPPKKCTGENTFADATNQNKALHIMQFGGGNILMAYNGYNAESVFLDEHQSQRLKQFLNK